MYLKIFIAVLIVVSLAAVFGRPKGPTLQELVSSGGDPYTKEQLMSVVVDGTFEPVFYIVERGGVPYSPEFLENTEVRGLR